MFCNLICKHLDSLWVLLTINASTMSKRACCAACIAWADWLELFPDLAALASRKARSARSSSRMSAGSWRNSSLVKRRGCDSDLEDDQEKEPSLYIGMVSAWGNNPLNLSPSSLKSLSTTNFSSPSLATSVYGVQFDRFVGDVSCPFHQTSSFFIRRQMSSLHQPCVLF